MSGIEEKQKKINTICAEGHLNELQNLVSAMECTQDEIRFCHDTPISLACEHGHLDIVKYIIENFEFNHQTELKYVFEQACGWGHLDIVKYLVDLLKYKTCDITSYALQYACWNGQFEVVSWLIWKFEIDFDDLFSQSFQWKIISKKRINIVSWFVRKCTIHCEKFEDFINHLEKSHNVFYNAIMEDVAKERIIEDELVMVKQY